MGVVSVLSMSTPGIDLLRTDEGTLHGPESCIRQRALDKQQRQEGPFREWNPGLRAPEARVIPLGQAANWRRSVARGRKLFSCVSRGVRAGATALSAAQAVAAPRGTGRMRHLA